MCLQMSCEVLSEGAQGCSCAALVHHHPAGLRDSLADVGLLINWGSDLARPQAAAQQGPEEHPDMGEEDKQSPSVGRFGRAPEFMPAAWDFPGLTMAARGAPANPLITEVLRDGLQGWVCWWVPGTMAAPSQPCSGGEGALATGIVCLPGAFSPLCWFV